MTNNDETMCTDGSLKAIRAELSAREPIFHQPELGTDRKTFESVTVEDFFEIGASGKLYSRNDVIDLLVERYSKPYVEDWQTSNFYCREIATDTYQLTYDLLQGEDRMTKRSTIWRRTAKGWKIVFHQGTVVAG